MKTLTKILKPGMNLFFENDRSKELYIIQYGKIKVYRKSGTREILLAVLGKGSVIGEMALIDGKPRSASAKAIEHSCVVQIDAEAFHKRIKGVPPWFMTMIRMTCKKIRNANLRLREISPEHQNISIILLIPYLIKYCGELSIDPASLEKQLIQLLGATHQRVTSVIKHLHNFGFISIEENRVVNVNQDTLREYCTFLRMFKHNQMSRYKTVEPKIALICKSVAENYPTLQNIDTDTVEITGEELINLFSDNYGQDQFHSLLETLINLEMLLCTRKSSNQNGSSLCGSIYRLLNPGWTHLYLLSKHMAKISHLCKITL